MAEFDIFNAPKTKVWYFDKSSFVTYPYNARQEKYTTVPKNMYVKDSPVYINPRILKVNPFNAAYTRNIALTAIIEAL